MLKHESVQGSVEGVYAEEKKAEETLRASENYLEAILNSIFAGVIVVDEKTHEIVDANPNALEAIGASKEHVIGKICHSFICPAEKGKCPISDLPECWHPLLWVFPKRKICDFLRQKKRHLGGLRSETWINVER
jgi:PAS domain-containing protein